MIGPAPADLQFQRSMAVLEVSDMIRSIDFYRDKLGFAASIWGEPPEFAIMQRGAVTIALDASRRAQAPGNQWWAAYVYVADADALYEEFRVLGVAIKREIQNSHYGCRDFDVVDPDGYILAFGQDLGSAGHGPGLGADWGRDGQPGAQPGSPGGRT